MLDEYRARLPMLRVFPQATNLGGPKNWEFVLAKAEGELVFLLCDDDAITPDFLETYLKLFADDPKLDMVLGDIELRGPSFDPLAPMPLSTPEGYLEIELAHRRMNGTQVREVLRDLLEVFPESRDDT
jgi:hypothetical protein